MCGSQFMCSGCHRLLHRFETHPSRTCQPGRFWLLRSAGSSIQCVPDLSVMAGGMTRIMTRPTMDAHRTMAAFRSGSVGRNSTGGPNRSCRLIRIRPSPTHGRMALPGSSTTAIVVAAVRRRHDDQPHRPGRHPALLGSRDQGLLRRAVPGPWTSPPPMCGCRPPAGRTPPRLPSNTLQWQRCPAWS